MRQGAHGCDGAYPRSRGATWGLRVPPTFWPGLSPLARGNLGQANLGATNYGPIPARAGQPSFADWSEARRWAYPRSRGATPTDRLQYVRTEGLSPLARGNLLDSQELFDRVGPIPARAGQPALRQGAHGCDGAYPRSRGATWGLRVPPTFWPGLSPLARGNLGQANLGATNYGPIPARAGQPSFADWSEARRWAYPRSRGATAALTSSG